MVELPAVEKVKPSLNKELESVMKAAVANFSAKRVVSSETTQSLCNVIEAIFIHGLKDTFFLRGSRYAKYPEPNFWPLISKYTHVNVNTQINNAKQIRTEIGRARAWVRIVINEGTLGTYIDNMTKDTISVKRFYVEEAFLRDSERVDTMMGYLKAFDKLKFDIPVNSAFLNGWTPSPLILSGVIQGKPMRADQRPTTSIRRRVNSVTMDDIQEDEVGVSALDLLDDAGHAKKDSVVSTPGRYQPGSRRPPSSASMPHLRVVNALRNEAFEEDDSSSVYSHPSMMDGGLLFNNGYPIKPTQIYSPVLSSTPETSAFVPPEGEIPVELQSSEVIVKHRRHRFRRGSGSGSREGSGSRKGSQARLQHDENIEMCTEGQTSSGASGISYPDSGIIVNNTSNSDRKESADIRTPPCSPTEEKTTYQLRTSSTKAVKIASKSETLEAGLSGSLRDELLGSGVALSSSGNSLVGKGWAMPLPCQNNSVESDRYSVFSSSAETETSGNSANFDTILKSAMNFQSAKELIPRITRNDDSGQIETLVRSKPDAGGSFVDTMNDGAANGGIEIAKLSIEETADEGSHRATCTYPKAQSDSLSSDMDDSDGRERDPATPDEDGDLVIIGSNLVSGIDEYGIEREPLPLLTRIAREKGIDSQNFRCQSCTRAIGLGLSPYKVCAFDARYYCEHCWSRDESLIPARLILNWDTRPRPISRRSKTFIESVADRPLIWLSEVNPKLYAHSATMDNIRRLREKLSLVAMYLLNCKQSIVEDFQRRLWGKDYLYREIHLYSFSDLINCTSGVLERHLNSLINFAVGHVQNCALCRQKGFICELCQVKQVIYPFQVETTSRCDKCFSVYHKKCFTKESRCPKCARREQYASTTLNDDSLSQNYLTLE
ncbi:hypothetical protein QR680_001213 [Steinernema hermaphroditum]|uniref:RUN domain-containing protein n=1 Tax=Steinernema hermaphroditum TaxID=289476 RepID=A0AA39LFM0_9BILA|nr:hypothetical protein QR680_001213 [Steinernema hermaphroditum]